MNDDDKFISSDDQSRLSFLSNSNSNREHVTVERNATKPAGNGANPKKNETEWRRFVAVGRRKRKVGAAIDFSALRAELHGQAAPSNADDVVAYDRRFGRRRRRHR